MHVDRHRRGPPTTAGTLDALPLALEAIARDLRELAGDVRELLEQDDDTMSPEAHFMLQRILGRLDTQSQAARLIGVRCKQALEGGVS